MVLYCSLCAYAQYMSTVHWTYLYCIFGEWRTEQISLHLTNVNVSHIYFHHPRTYSIFQTWDMASISSSNSALSTAAVKIIIKLCAFIYIPKRNYTGSHWLKTFVTHDWSTCLAVQDECFPAGWVYYSFRHSSWQCLGNLLEKPWKSTEDALTSTKKPKVPQLFKSVSTYRLPIQP